MNESTKRKMAIAFGVLGVVYMVDLFFSTLSIDVVSLEPVDCRKLYQLPTQHYDDNRFFAELRLKRKAKNVGADTLYIPLQISSLQLSKGMLTGVPYDCSGR